MKHISLILVLIILFGVACMNKSTKPSLSQEETDLYVEKGRVITSTSFGVISSNLRAVLISQGVKEAIQYCSLNAYPLTDSLSEEFNVSIKRTSSFIRNPENKPDKNEQQMLDYFAELHEKGEPLYPEVKIMEDSTVVYYEAITVNTPLCLNCHGKLVENVNVEDYKMIKKIYPADLAVDYELNDLRGMWSIRFKSVRL